MYIILMVTLFIYTILKYCINKYITYFIMSNIYIFNVVIIIPPF